MNDNITVIGHRAPHPPIHTNIFTVSDAAGVGVQMPIRLSKVITPERLLNLWQELHLSKAIAPKIRLNLWRLVV